MDKLNPKNEPIVFGALVVVVGWVVTRIGLGMDADTVKAVCILLAAGGTFSARALSVPLAKHEKQIKQVVQAATPPPVMDPKP